MRHLLIASLALSIGCKGGIPNLGDLKDMLPKLRYSKMKVDSVDFQKIGTTFVFEVDNPYPVGLELQSLDWALGLSGSPFLDGTDSKGMDIDPGATSKIRIPVKLAWADAFAVAGGLKGADDVPFDLTGKVGFKTPVGPVDIPFAQDGAFPMLHVPKVQLTGLKLTSFKPFENKASLALDVNVSSEQKTPLTFPKFGYNIKLDGADVATGDASVPDGGGTVSVPIDLNLLNLGSTVVKAITDKSKLTVGFAANADIGTPLGIVPLAISESSKLQLK